MQDAFDMISNINEKARSWRTSNDGALYPQTRDVMQRLRLGIDAFKPIKVKFNNLIPYFLFFQLLFIGCFSRRRLFLHSVISVTRLREA